MVTVVAQALGQLGTGWTVVLVVVALVVIGAVLYFPVRAAVTRANRQVDPPEDAAPPPPPDG